jgi:hypothetical protein
MSKRLRAGSVLMMLTLLVGGAPAGVAQGGAPARLPELKKTATLAEGLEWLGTALLSYTGVGVEEGDTGIELFKGFTVVRADGCTLSLKNKGTFPETQSPYLFEATLPVADLNPSSSKLRQRVTDFPKINETYGTWVVKFSTKGGAKTARIAAHIFSKGSQGTSEFQGPRVVFKFQEKEDAQVFEQGFKQLIQMCQAK